MIFGFTSTFWRVCLSAVLFMGSFNMIIPELPAFIRSIADDADQYLGLNIFLFTVTAGLARPFSGVIADKSGRVKVMVIGAAVCVVIGIGYTFASSLLVYFILRTLHGFSTGFKPTGTVAYVADIVPISKRGEAMGFVGMAGSIGSSIGHYLGSWTSINYGFDALFITSSLIAFLSIIIILGIPESLKEKEPIRWHFFKPKNLLIYNPNVLIPTIIMVLIMFSYGVILTVIPDKTNALGIGNRGVFTSISIFVSIAGRFITRSYSDRYGRVPILMIGSLILALSMVLVAFSSSPIIFYFAAVSYGIAVGLNAPTIYAWSMDKVNPERRGMELAIVYIGQEIGIGGGAFLSGYLLTIFNDNALFIIFVGTTIISLISFIILGLEQKKI